MAHIYVITNKINNKQYVGKTLQSVKERFSEHLYRLKYGKHNHLPLYAAFVKYGIDNFIIEEKEEVTVEQLDVQESFWIKELNTLAPNGYNLTLGGEGTIYHDREKILKLFEEDLSYEGIIEKSEASKATIYRISKEYNIKPKVRTKKKPTTNQNRFKKVYMFNLQGVFLQKFESVVEAIEYLKKLGIELSDYSAKINILKCCRKEPKRKTAYKHIWRYTPEL